MTIRSDWIINATTVFFLSELKIIVHIKSVYYSPNFFLYSSHTVKTQVIKISVAFLSVALVTLLALLFTLPIAWLILGKV